MTALDLTKRGVRFQHNETGQPYLGNTRSHAAEIAAEVAARVARMRPLVPASGRVPLLRIVDRETARWGECMTCGDPLASHCGGQCFLCIAAQRKVLRDAGRIP